MGTTRSIATLGALTLGLALVGCGGAADDGAAAGSAAADTMAAAGAGGMSGMGGAITAMMRDSSGRDLGTLTFTEAAAGITVVGTLRGLPPGEHGIHLHAVGACTAPSFESAGGHWNPTSREHGTQSPQGPHLGDLPNVTVRADSTVDVQVTTPGGSLRGTTGALDADGAAVVVHAGPDDYRTDPSGSSGARLACGVVTGG